MQCPLIFYYAVEYHLLGRVIQKFELEQPIQPQCPLIFYYAVEYHLLGRVIQKFELEQPIQPQIVCTSIDLHRKLFCYV
jgi:hypothetical protein